MYNTDFTRRYGLWISSQKKFNLTRLSPLLQAKELTAAMPKVEVFYDCSSPWAYLGFVRMHRLAAKMGFDIIWRPVLVGGVFNEVNQVIYTARENMFDNERKSSHFFKDLQNWADYAGIVIKWPQWHPGKSVKCMRGAFVAEDHNLLVEYSLKMFEAYWQHNEEVDDAATLTRVCNELGINPGEFFDKIADPVYKAKLKTNTDEVIARGGYGVPSIFINDTDMYFGNDRMPLVEKALEKLA